MEKETGKPGNKNISFNVVSNNSKHNKGGFGAGALNLSNLASIIIDNGEAYLDNGAIHAKSKIEKGIRFTTNREEVPNGRKCWVVWVNVDRGEESKFYAGIAACEMSIDSESRKGWKILADHVNKMDYALKGRYILDGLDGEEKAALRMLLQEHNEKWWEHTPEELKSKLA